MQRAAELESRGGNDVKKSICIPVEQYNKMLESYDEAMKELRRLQRELRTIRYGKPGNCGGETNDES